MFAIAIDQSKRPKVAAAATTATTYLPTAVAAKSL